MYSNFFDVSSTVPDISNDGGRLKLNLFFAK
jgi:hypothetical protein